jgi:hypothetical protein
MKNGYISLGFAITTVIGFIMLYTSVIAPAVEQIKNFNF